MLSLSLSRIASYRVTGAGGAHSVGGSGGVESETVAAAGGGGVSYTLSLIRKSLRSVHMSKAEAFEEDIPHIFIIFGASVSTLDLLLLLFLLLFIHFLRLINWQRSTFQDWNEVTKLQMLNPLFY